MRRAVGIFFFLGLILLGALTLFVDNEVNPFKRAGYCYFITIPDAAGLEKGGQVRLAGMVAGSITDIKMLDDGSGIRVDFRLREGLRLRQDTLASLEATSLLGNGRTIGLSLGSQTAAYLPEATHPENAAQVVRVQGPVAIEEVVRKADKFFGDIKDVGPAIREAADHISSITKKIDTGEGTLGKIVNDPELYKDLRGALAKLNEGLDSFKVIAAKTEKGEGTLGKLINDPVLYDNLREASKDLAELTKKLNSSDGTLGRLVNDPALYDDIKKTTSALAAVMGKIEKGEGTLGRLVNDDGLYVEARRFLKEAREAVEDSREQAPITAFSSVIFAAFQ
ncbi:MAG TPA: MlaD family protein [Planctomycetota bacterium]|nr:MlaD family protein [Planctomycetota bacterium]